MDGLLLHRNYNFIECDYCIFFLYCLTVTPSVSGWQFVSKAFDLSDGDDSTTMTPKSIIISLNYSRQGNFAYFDNISLVKEPSQSYTYDSDGNLVSVVANAKQNATMDYDDNNNLTSYVDPKDYAYEYTYNDNGKILVNSERILQNQINLVLKVCH